MSKFEMREDIPLRFKRTSTGRNLNANDIKNICLLYQSNYKLSTIAKLYKCSQTTIYRNVLKNGLSGMRDKRKQPVDNYLEFSHWETINRKLAEIQEDLKKLTERVIRLTRSDTIKNP